MIKTIFGYVLEFFYNFTNNYGLALILFSLAVKIILFPASAKSKKSMMKTSRLQPRVKELELAYGDDKTGYQQAVQALYKEEGVSMFGGCLWSLLPLLIIFPLYKVIQMPLDYILHLDAEVVSSLKSAYASAEGLELDKVGYYWQFVVGSNIEKFGEGIVEGVKSLELSLWGIDLGPTPSWKFWTMTTWSQFGAALLPVISGALSYLSMFVSTKMNNTVISNEKGEHDEETAKAATTGKTMQLMMPLMSVIFGFMFPAGISIYWVSQSLFGIVQDVILTAHYRKVYDAEDEVRREKAAIRAAEEAEKERIRAAKRAANPEGINANSKKKQQLREKQEREAAAKDYETRRRIELGLPVEENDEEEFPGGEPGRPYARGRAYSADHYGKSKE
ncbi:MAG: YidC/Oxa1 family membrane protein insertase [Oscillospiraceae bacterium]|nr:YidC/Oxa1 family membrane protein insertase [Oscillospiraceae bacterium]